VYILAETLHGVNFKSNFMNFIFDTKYMVFAGFQFNNSGYAQAFILQSDNRIACNNFIKSKDSPIAISGSDADRTEIDHNVINGSGGKGLAISRCSPIDSSCKKNSMNIHIHHNTFKNKAYGGSNGHEAIVLGTGWDPLPGKPIYNKNGSNFDSIIENNLFDSWNGENELVTIKSSGNILRNNCIINSGGSNFKVRNSNNNLITGNWMDQVSNIAFSGSGNVFAFNYYSAKDPKYAFGFHSTVAFDKDGYRDYYAYSPTNDNIIKYNVINNVTSMIDVYRFPHRFMGQPVNNQITDNHIYSLIYNGTENAGGYSNTTTLNNKNGADTVHPYSESDFRNKNQWGRNTIVKKKLLPTACGNSALFQGPGGKNAMVNGHSKLQGGASNIKPPSWW
jgi:hypothetical protein